MGVNGWVFADVGFCLLYMCGTRGDTSRLRARHAGHDLTHQWNITHGIEQSTTLGIVECMNLATSIKSLNIDALVRLRRAMRLNLAGHHQEIYHYLGTYTVGRLA